MNKLKGYYLENCNSERTIEPPNEVIEEILKARYTELKTVDKSYNELKKLYESGLYTPDDSYYIGLFIVMEFIGTQKLISKIDMILNTVTVDYDNASKVVRSCSIIESLKENHLDHSKDC